MGERKGTKALELWCKRLVDGHPGVKIENMSTSWRNGLAFCALIHHFRPDLIDFASLKPEDIYYNNELAFRTAETHLGIPALLDPEDMVDHEVPDRLSLLTYLSQFYQRLGSSGTPKKSSSSIDEGKVTPTPAPRKKLPDLASLKIGKSGYEPCTVCSLPVYLAQRLLVSHRLYHRRCFRCSECNAQLSPASCYENATGTEFCCETCNNVEANIFSGKEGHVETSIEIYDEVFNETERKLAEESRTMENVRKSIDVLPTVLPISERLSHFEPKSSLGDESTISPTYRLKARATDIEKRNFLLSNLADDNPDTINSLDNSRNSTTGHSSLVKSRISIFENDDKLLKKGTESDSSLTHQSSPNTLQRVDSNIDKFVFNDTPLTFLDRENKRISDSIDEEMKIEISDIDAKKSNMNDHDEWKEMSGNKYDYEIKFDDNSIITSEPKNTKESDLEETKEEEVNETSVEDLLPDFKNLGLNVNTDDHLETEQKVIQHEKEVSIEEKEILKQEKESLPEENNVLTEKNKVLEEEREDLTEREKLPQKENGLIREEGKYLLQDKEDSTVNKEVLNKAGDLPKEETAVRKEEKENVKEEKNVLKEENQVQQVEKQKKAKLYPDDLNPFTDDEEEEDGVMEKHESTNPFGSSDEEDVEDDSPREKKLSNATLNPFWSDGEEPSSEEDETPVKTNNKQHKMSPQSYSTASPSTISVVSPRRKKAMAPRPPTITVHEAPQLNDSLTLQVHSNSKYTDDRCSVSSFSSHCSTVHSDTKSLRSSPRARRKRPAPPAPASLHASLLSTNQEQEHSIASLNKTLDSYFDNEDEKSSRWRRHKGPAPGLPLPGRRVVRTELTLPQIHTELEHLETQQQGLEKQGVLLEQMIREKCEGEHSVDVPQEEVEDLVIQLCELVNEKNDLFRKQAELMYIRRQQRLEQEQADIEHEIRVIQSRPAVNRIDSDKVREEYLVARLLAVVRLRDQLVQQLDSERRREMAEDRAIATSIAERRAHRSMEQKSVSMQSLDSSPKKKNKVKDRVKKQLKKAKELTTGSKKKEECKSDESLGGHSVKTLKTEKTKWFNAKF